MTGATNRDPGHGSKDPGKTITLADRDVQAAARLLTAIVGVDNDRGRELTNLAKADLIESLSHDKMVLVERARQAYVNRARRSQIFNSVMFGEAAWDMLLALYVTDQSGSRHTVSGLTELAGVPPTTALRWLNFLEVTEELVSRKPSPLDRRVFRVELTDKARTLLDTYLSGTG